MEKFKLFLRVRLGQFRIGMRVERLSHSFVLRFLFSRVADTAGVLNKFANTERQCLFMDFDDRADIFTIKDRVQRMQHKYNLGDVLIFKSSENHYVGVCFDLRTRDDIKEMMNYLSPIMDYRFTYVYSRDGFNALRIAPKVVGADIFRKMSLQQVICGGSHYEIKHRGLIEVFDELFNCIPAWYWNYTDNSNKYDDVFERRYETINW